MTASKVSAAMTIATHQTQVLPVADFKLMILSPPDMVPFAKIGIL